MRSPRGRKFARLLALRTLPIRPLTSVSLDRFLTSDQASHALISRVRKLGGEGHRHLTQLLFRTPEDAAFRRALGDPDSSPMRHGPCGPWRPRRPSGRMVLAPPLHTPYCLQLTRECRVHLLSRRESGETKIVYLHSVLPLHLATQPSHHPCHPRHLLQRVCELRQCGVAGRVLAASIPHQRLSAA